MELDRTATLTYYLRFLSGNPDGDAAARALVLGALAPVAGWSAAVYAAGRSSNLEIVGSYGVIDELTGGLRTVPTGMPMPLCEAYLSMRPISVPAGELLDRYPVLASEPRLHGDDALPEGAGAVVFAPLICSGVAIGVVALVQERPTPWAPDEWQYLDGVLAATAMWLNNQREVLVVNLGSRNVLGRHRRLSCRRVMSGAVQHPGFAASRPVGGRSVAAGGGHRPSAGSSVRRARTGGARRGSCP